MRAKADILIVDDEENTLASLARGFRLERHEAVVCGNAVRALELASTRPFDHGSDGAAVREEHNRGPAGWGRLGAAFGTRGRFERDEIAAELQRSGRNVTNAAKALGLERSYLYKKCQQLGIDLRRPTDAAGALPIGVDDSIW